MILVCFCVVSVRGYSMVRQLQTREKYQVLPSFGFSKGGHFLIRLLAQNLTGVRAYLLPQRYAEFFHRSSLTTTSVCAENFVAEPYASFSPESSDTWEGVVSSSQVLVPLIANCKGMKPTVTVKMQNNGTFLDAREQGIPELYLILTFVYAGICIAFMVNQCFFGEFLISLHTWIAFAAILKGFVCYMAADLWETRSVHGEYRTISSVLSVKEVLLELLFVFAHSVLFAVDGLAVMGFGTYDEVMEFEDVWRVGFLSVLFFGGISVLWHATNALLYVLMLFVVIVSFLFYFMFVDSSIRATVGMYTVLASVDRPVMLLKLKLALKFSQLVSMWMVLLFFAWIYFLYSPSWLFMLTFVHEMFMLGLFVINMVCFFYRKGFKDRNLRIHEVEDVDDTTTEEETKMVTLIEPDEQDIAYVSRPILSHL